MKPIQVTEPFLPPLDEYIEFLKGIWARNELTNQGPLVKELEGRLQAYNRLSVPVHCLANGGLGLQIILKALGVKGEIITTPFSYVATASCPLWEGCTLRFADIEPDYLTVDPAAVEAAITPQSEAILATHVFGNPCDVEALEMIAKKHNLALIYDAAHAFGVEYKGKSILEYGDASMVSLHATKILHSVEGSFVVARDSRVSERIEWMRRFGHNGPGFYHGIGINGKMSELHAAMGLCVFNHLEDVLERRKVVCEAYDSYFFSASNGLDQTVRVKNSVKVGTSTRSFVLPKVEAPIAEIMPYCYRDDSTRNYSYFPVLFNDEASLISTLEVMNAEGIYPRRYFWPDLENALATACADSRWRCQTSEAGISVALDVSRRIICMPLSANMEVRDVFGRLDPLLV